jgi:mitochondrial pyruvate carrier 2
VNFFLGLVGIVQVSRIVNYNYSVKGKTTADQVEEAKEGVTDVAHDLKGKAVDAVKS